MNTTVMTVNISAAKKCLSDSVQLISEKKNEQVIRDSFTSHLRQIFTDTPNWIIRHIQNSEAAVKINKGTTVSTGFIDNLVDLIAIEYEGNLTIKSKFDTGFNQVKDYCAALINRGNDSDLVIGILSDTVRWYAYTVEVNPIAIMPYNRDSIILNQIDFIDCSQADDKASNDLIIFLQKYLGRVGARPVSAFSIAKDLGFGSQFCSIYLSLLEEIITKTFKDNPKYAELVSSLWCNFVSYLREEGYSKYFDIKTYIDEYYILTLGKLICANFIEKKALSSDETELLDIISGRYFENKGLINFIEYDYFGWINSLPIADKITPIARLIQQDLLVYNFVSDPDEDLFGKLMAQLANRSQRLLLGQEWTPSWLSHKLVHHVIDNIPPHESIRLLDMCCGSGSMIVESLKIIKDRINANVDINDREERINLLVQSMTGFDIDPLAVMLSKINWLLVTMDWIRPLGTFNISIPIYHADSLFAITPISNNIVSETNTYILKIAEFSIELPGFLITPQYREFFDSLISVAYRLALSNGSSSISLHIEKDELLMYIQDIINSLARDLNPDQIEMVLDFLEQFICKIDILNRDGRNGIWSYILRNSFRPGLVLGQFNGLVSNPPWLALSKVADNPYHIVLKRKAEEFGIKPEGSSHLHIELATIFLLHAVSQYMTEGAHIGCIVPDTVLNGHHHNPFRKAKYLTSKIPVPLKINEIWKIDGFVFKNKAVILLGQKQLPDTNQSTSISGSIIYENRPSAEITLYNNIQGNRTAWSERLITGEEGFYSPGAFRQGADIMPRNLLFYEVSSCDNVNNVSIRSIDPTTSSIGYIVRDAKRFKEFRLTERVVKRDLIYDVITSNLLTPYHISTFQQVFLPIKKESDKWVKLSNREIIAKGPIVQNTFESIFKTIDPINGNIDSLFSLLDVRGKLSQQIISATGFIVMTGAGGKNVCAAYINLDNESIITDRLIIDQTIYWAHVDTEDEAIYLTGLFNSEAINSIIQEFQPRGAFGERHIHTLPFGVTPPYDASQVAHQDVVEKTSNLISEYDELLQDSDITELLDPNTSALTRRRRILVAHIKSLTSYQEYEEACRALYGL